MVMTMVASRRDGDLSSRRAADLTRARIFCRLSVSNGAASRGVRIRFPEGPVLTGGAFAFLTPE